MYRINIKVLALFSVLLCIILISAVWLLLSSIPDEQSNSGEGNSNKDVEQPYIQTTILDKLKSNNEELLERLRAEKVKTFVILGTDERAAEISRSDIIMVIRFDAETNNAIIVSVPRDTRVKIPGRKYDKINHAYAFGGPELSIETLESLFEIPIDYYFKFGFEDFKPIVDNLNGVRINAQKDFKEYETVRIYKGEQILNGEDALFYVRFRDDSEGDYGRIKRQQEVVRAMTDSILHFDKEKLTPIISKLYSDVINTNMDIAEVNAYLELIDAKENISITATTLKTHTVIINGIYYEEFKAEDLTETIELLKGEKNGTGISGD